jgi:thiamine-monophosphate kinase
MEAAAGQIMSLSEDTLVAWLTEQRRLPESLVPVGIGDDMAQINLSQESSVLITTDMLLEGVHFDLSDCTLEQVGYKAMAVNLSDCAAMATVPLAAVVAVALPKSMTSDDFKQLHTGLLKAADQFDCPLVGGDITKWRHGSALAINVSMLSRQGASGPVLRSGAKVGDTICVTGALGGSLLGKHLTFTPRVKEALTLTQLVKIHAMMDLSDGLSTDLTRLCASSQVGATIEAKKIPISEAAAQRLDPMGAALDDGEDFELLFTLSSNHAVDLLQQWTDPLMITPIGKVTDSGRTELVRADGHIQRLQPAGYDHLTEE